jgi:hypothetical protein
MSILKIRILVEVLPKFTLFMDHIYFSLLNLGEILSGMTTSIIIVVSSAFRESGSLNESYVLSNELHPREYSKRRSPIQWKYLSGATPVLDSR